VTPERYEEIANLFHEATELEVPARKQFLAAACGPDTALLREVESLLAAGNEAGEFLASGPAAERAAESSIPTGRRIGHYVIDSLLGAGGMGQVYLATDSRLGRKVAVKVLPRETAERPESLKRFEAEARAASALNHPNIVTVYDVGVSDVGRFLVMEHIAGRTLQEMLADGPIPDAIPKLGAQMARALKTAHAGGITHRDIKPENIMVRHDGFVKVLDFGLARLVYSDDLVTKSGGNMRLMGTVRYMSPEQACGRDTTASTDVFSLGIVFYQMATGKHPFASESTLGTLHAIITTTPPLPSAVNPSLPAGLEQLILAMMEKEPARRATAAEVEAALDSAAGLEARAPVARLNVPAHRTPFIGREAELASIEPLLRDHKLRLLTLTGPGGTGKTRLAVQAAEYALPAFPGGVYFCDLTELTEAYMVLPAISKTLGIRDAAEQDLVKAIAHHLDTPDATLLVLDNFEHLLDAASRIAGLLQRCPALKILVTSRLALRLYGEQEFPVPPMPLPAESGHLDIERLGEFASVALFVQRAAAVKPGFQLTADNAPAVSELCRRLDGLPLAIELAASRVKVLPPASLLARIENRLALLTGGSRDLPERHQTLRRTIDWSYEQLTEPERKLFARLAAFVGGCTLEAAEAVCNTREDLGIDLMEGISSLIDKSLIKQPADDAAEPRFGMLETIREYARERLAESAEMAEVEKAHAAYFLVLSEEIGAANAESQQASLAAYEREYGNVRTAIRRLVQAGNEEWAMRLGGSQIWFWEKVEYFGEGRELLEMILRMPGAQSPTLLRARVAYSLGAIYYRLGDFGPARRWQEDEALPVFRQVGDLQGAASTLIGVALIKHSMQKVEEATEDLQESVQLWRALGNDSAADYALHNLGRFAVAQKDFATAWAILEPLAANFEARGDLWGAASAYCSMGDAAASQGHFFKSKSYHLDGLERYRKIGDAASMARVLADVGNVAREVGDYTGADAYYRESLGMAMEAARRTMMARALAELGKSALAQGHFERAVMLSGAASEHFRGIGDSNVAQYRQTFLETLEQARASLDAAIYARTLGRAKSLTLDQTLEYALGTD